MDWTQVVTHPLGLAGFALALVFGLIGVKGTRQSGWLAPVGTLMAVLALAGGLYLAYLDTRRQTPLSDQAGVQLPTPAAKPDTPLPQPPRPADPITQTGAVASGTGAVAVSGSEVGGGIHIDVRQTGRTDEK